MNQCRAAPRPHAAGQKRPSASQMPPATSRSEKSTVLPCLVSKTVPRCSSCCGGCAAAVMALTNSDRALDTITMRAPLQRYISSSLPLSPQASVLEGTKFRCDMANSMAFSLPAWAEQTSTSFQAPSPEEITWYSDPSASRRLAMPVSKCSSISYAVGMRYGSCSGLPRMSNRGNCETSLASAAERSKSSMVAFQPGSSLSWSSGASHHPIRGSSRGTL
mmetsp:Transcript_1865/g.4786  ORF Transcript_1865/g.4786 Transcript_1865/m.4786 type:complete len:219 (+) Transcript_1865:88-744(+)